MRVFVAGATGVLGRALLPQLIAGGHEAFGLARSTEKAAQVERAGATALRGDVLDAAEMRRAMQEIRPEAVVNLATTMPLKLRLDLKDWELNDRVRVEGSANLLAAAREVKPRLFVQESAGFVYQPQAAAWIDEESPRDTHSFVRATARMEDQVRAAGLPTTLLRFAALNSADSWHTQQVVAALRRGMLPIVGDGGAFISQIHAFDTAQAVVRALDNPQAAAGQTFNVTDDEPARMRDTFPYAARLLNAPAPKQVPPFVAKLVVGPLTVERLTASYRLANAKIKSVLGFVPRYPSYRETWAQIAQEVSGRDFTPSGELS